MTKPPSNGARTVAFEVAVSSVEYQTDITRRLERRLRMRVQPHAPSELIWPGREGHRKGGSRATIFGQSARVVVVLYARGWEKASTTVEDRAAIKRRIAADGTGSVRVVVLDGAAPPAWLRGAPKRDARDGDVESCAEWIAEAVRDAGGETRRPPTVDTVVTSDEDRLAHDRDAFLGSHRAIAHLAREFDRLATEVAHRVETVVPGDGETTAEVHRAPGRCTVQLGPVALSLSWVRTRPDSVSTGRLMIIEWQGKIGGSAADGRPRAVPLREDVLRVEATRAEDWQWRSEDGAARVYDSRALAARCVDSLTKALRTHAAPSRAARNGVERGGVSR